MCLAQVYDEKPKKTSGTGWKVFVKSNRVLSGSCTSGFYKPNKWYKATYSSDTYPGPGSQLIGSVGEQKFERKYKYPLSFHIFIHKKDAQKAAKFFHEELRKVRYRGAHTLGRGNPPYPGEQIIADEIMVLSRKQSV